MSRFTSAAPLLIDGNFARSVCLDERTDMVEQPVSGGVGYIIGRSNYTLEIVTHTQDNQPTPTFEHNTNYLGFGYGFICHHCQTYTPRGNYLCQNCTAPLTKKLLAPFTFPFTFTQLDTSLSSWGFGTNTYTFVADDVASDVLQQLFADGAKLVPTREFIKIKHGCFMCEFCGGISTDGQRCNRCDGGRLPFKELVDINNECVYCHTITSNGVVCESCGASLVGTALDQLAPVGLPLLPFMED